MFKKNREKEEFQLTIQSMIGDDFDIFLGSMDVLIHL